LCSLLFHQLIYNFSIAVIPPSASHPLNFSIINPPHYYNNRITSKNATYPPKNLPFLQIFLQKIIGFHKKGRERRFILPAMPAARPALFSSVNIS
jgi:hypothetical protein